MFDQEPPASLTAEACVLGAMILEPKCVDEVTELLGRDPAVFFSEAHGAIYAAILHTVDSKNAGDLALIVQYLKDRDELDDVGGREYLAQLADTVHEHGAMTAAVYSTSEDVLDAAREVVQTLPEHLVRGEPRVDVLRAGGRGHAPLEVLVRLVDLAGQPIPRDGHVGS